MSYRSTCLIACVLLLVLCDRLNAEPLILSSSNWEKELEKGKVFVKFYAPWCGFCKKLAPVWDELSSDALLKENNIQIAKVDCTDPQNDALCRQYGVKSYPTLKLFYNAKEQKFEGGDRTLDNLRKFAVETTPSNPVGVQLTPQWTPKEGIINLTMNEVHNVKEGVWVLAFTANWCENCKKLQQEYDRVAENYKNTDVKVAQIDIESKHGGFLKRLFTVTEVPTIKVIRDGKMYNLTYASQSTRDLIKFVNTDYKNSAANPLPQLPEKTPLSGKQAATDNSPQPSTTATSIRIPDLQAMQEYFRDRPEEALMGLGAGTILFFLGFILGRATASPAVVPTKAKKQQ